MSSKDKPYLTPREKELRGIRRKALLAIVLEGVAVGLAIAAIILRLYGM